MPGHRVAESPVQRPRPRPWVHLVGAGLAGTVVALTDGLLALNATGSKSLSGEESVALSAVSIGLVIPVTAVAGLLSGFILYCTWRWVSPEAIKAMFRRPRLRLISWRGSSYVSREASFS